MILVTDKGNVSSRDELNKILNRYGKQNVKLLAYVRGSDVYISNSPYDMCNLFKALVNDAKISGNYVFDYNSLTDLINLFVTLVFDELERGGFYS